MSRLALALLTSLGLGCSCGGVSPPPIAPAPPPPPPAGPTYEVHEWGLVRGTADDHVMIAGPHAEPVLVVTKPVLYFHRHGEGSLVVDVEARIPGGRVVESWPMLGGVPGTSVRWDDVLIQGDACHGSRYPGFGEEPCSFLSDGCEAATLASVETTDSNCLYWPTPIDDGPTQAWNHLFYRGEIDTTPPMALRAEPLPDGTLRLTATGPSPVPGHVLRIRRANGTPGVTDALEIAEPPAPGSSVIVAAPTAALTGGPEALGASLSAAGLTDDEVAAFRRAWDGELFGDGAMTSGWVTTVMPSAPAARPPTTSILYVLPSAAADAIAVLSFSPPPTAIRRAIVLWIDETSAR